jgi:hypothetical protein
VLALIAYKNQDHNKDNNNSNNSNNEVIDINDLIDLRLKLSITQLGL